MTRKRSVAGLVLARHTKTAIAMISIALGLCWQLASAAPIAPASRSGAKLLSVPLSFEPNRGQAESTVQFLSRGSGYALFLAPG